MKLINQFLDWVANQIDVLVLSLIAFITPIENWIIFITILMSLSFLTKVAHFNKLQKKLKSHHARESIYRYMIYIIAIFVTHLCMNQFNLEINLVALLGISIAAIEVKAMDENMKSVLGVSLLTTLINALKPKESKKDDENKEDNNS